MEKIINNFLNIKFIYNLKQIKNSIFLWVDEVNFIRVVYWNSLYSYLEKLYFWVTDEEKKGTFQVYWHYAL